MIPPFGSMTPPMPSMASPGAPMDNSPGAMGMQILKTAIAQRGKAGAPPSLLPQFMPTGGGAAPGGGQQPGMLQGLLAKLGMGGQPGAGGAPAMGAGGFNPLSGMADAFKQNAMMPMRDPNAPMTGMPPVGPPVMPGAPAAARGVPSSPLAAAVPLPQAAPPRPFMLDAGTPLDMPIG